MSYSSSLNPGHIFFTSAQLPGTKKTTSFCDWLRHQEKYHMNSTFLQDISNELNLRFDLPGNLVTAVFTIVIHSENQWLGLI